MMTARGRLFAAALTAAALPGTALAQAQPLPGPASSAGQESAVAALLEQANYWRLQNRPELVLRTLERVLVVDPRNVDALAGASQAQAALGNRAQAEGYLARLRQLAPADPRLNETDITVRAATVDQGALAEARRLGQSGRAAEAIQRYRELFRGGTPPDAYAQEYYSTLAGTEGGYAEARSGLQRLVERSPDNGRLALAYAQLLTYRDPTRGDGIARLRSLAANPELSTAANAAWRQALLWQGANPALVPELQAFLERFPADAAVAQKLAEAQNPPSGPPDESGLSRIRGFEQLNNNRLREAQREFEASITRNPEDAEATGGLGLVRLREGRFGEARTLLERAIRLAPDKREQWQRALDGAGYAADLQVARGQLQAGNLDAAEQSLRRATARDTGDRADADALLGDLALRRGDLAGAEARYRAALGRRPNLGAAATGLYEVLQQQGRFAEAEDLQRRSTALSVSGDAGAQRAAQLRTEAQRAADPVSAIALLRAAQQADPASPWIRLDLARLLQRQGRRTEAQQVAESPNNSPEGLYAQALFASEDGRPAEVAGLINRIPVRLRNADMNRLLARSRVDDDVQRAVQLWRNGRRAEARAGLFAIAGRPDPTGSAGELAVRAFGTLNDAAGAAEAGRTATAANPRASATARLALASAMLAAGAEQEAVALARQVEQQPGLSGEERRQSLSLQAGLAIRASDRLNEQGDQAGAFDALAPVLARDPRSVPANLALARLYQGANQPREAAEIAEGVLRAEPASLDARFAAVDAAIGARDWGKAEALLLEARAFNGNDPRVALLEARLARAAGNSARALRALEVAAETRRAQVGTPAAQQGGGGALLADGGFDNPFRRLSRSGAVGGPIGTGADPLSNEIQQELAAVREETAARIQGGIGFRTRSGTAGTGRLQEFSAPVDASIGAGSLGGRITASITPVQIGSDKLDTTTTDNVRSYGSNALALSGTTTQLQRDRLAPRDTNASGVGVGLAYARSNLAVDVGTTPIGFRQQNVVGGLEFAPSIANGIRLRLTGEQRAVTDSLLSWAGARDPLTNRTWGGVVRTGGRGQVEFGAGPTSIYLGGGYSSFTGANVARNNRYEFGAGLSYTVWRRPEDELQAGLDIVYFSYDKNQRLFTLGNGGYFSPQSYFAVNLPVDWRGRSGDLAWRLGGTVGYQTYREDSASFFPRDSAAQSALAASGAVATQAARSESGVVGGVRGDLEYSLSPNLRIGGLLRYDRSATWNEARGVLFARYRFDR